MAKIGQPIRTEAKWVRMGSFKIGRRQSHQLALKFVFQKINNIITRKEYGRQNKTKRTKS